MKALLRLFSSLMFLSLVAGSAWGGGLPGRITILAPNMHTTPEGLVVAEGGIMILGEGIQVRAEALRFDPSTQILSLAGQVEMEEEAGGVTVKGDSLVLDLSDLTGGVRRGEIILEPEGFRVRGKDIRRLGPEEFKVSQGVFTTCPGECPDWSFTASRIWVREEGYLTASNAAFRIAGIPVFYMPFLFYPVKTQRQTGFLIPEIRMSEEFGLETSWPFFITLGSHADLTLTPRTFSRDSFGLAGEGRYRLEYGGGGDWSGFAIGGEEDGRWYFRGDHAMSLAEGIWLRGRWYDTGDPAVPGLFGETFGDRHPGAVLRHATIQAKWEFLDLAAGSDRLLSDGAFARADTPNGHLERERLEVHLGPVEAGVFRAGLSGEQAQFGEGMERNFIIPSLHLDLPGFEGLSGSLYGEAFLSLGGDGTQEDEAYLFTLRERASVAARGKWGSHRIDLDLEFSAVEGADFNSFQVRDGKDSIEDRRMGLAAVRSRLVSGGVAWDLEIGGWRDSDLDFQMGYGQTLLSSRGFFLEGSVNRDAQWGRVLPSLDVREVSAKGWSVKAGYEREDFELVLGREATVGFPDLVSGRVRFPVLGAELSGEAIYDLDARTMADEILSLEIPGRCWSLILSRLQSPERTDWRMSFDLGL